MKKRKEKQLIDNENECLIKNKKEQTKKKKSSSAITIIDTKEVEEIRKLIPNGYFLYSKECIMYAPYGKNYSCDTVGIDIGKVHMAFAGVTKDSSKKLPIFSFIILFSFPKSKSANDTCRFIEEYINNHPDLEWVRRAIHIRVEQQVQLNPKARQIAQGVISCFRTRYLILNTPWKTVTTVHGELKYNIAPKYCEKSRLNPLRLESTSGLKNKSKRKKLSINDCEDLLDLQNEKEMKQFLNVAKQYLCDQLHDITDSMLIAMVNS